MATPFHKLPTGEPPGIDPLIPYRGRIWTRVLPQRVDLPDVMLQRLGAVPQETPRATEIYYHRC